jgi:hypothetical protein
MSMLEKFMELDGLIRACLPHMTNPRAVADVLERLDDPNLRQDILTKNADKYLANVPIGVLEMNECWVRYPLLADIWDIVQKDLVRSGLLPWAMEYPERALEGRMLGRLMEEIDSEIATQPITALPRPSVNVELPLLATEIHTPYVPPSLPPEVAAPMDEAIDASPTVRPRRVPIGPRPEHQNHATYMAEQMAALHEEVAHVDDWTPDTLPVPPGEIDAAAETVKRALKKIPKRSKR